MKVLMFQWSFGPENLPDWFKHNQCADISMEQMLELYNTGNNVALFHHAGQQAETILAVDNKRFTQR